jgi:hypothetical protein
MGREVVVVITEGELDFGPWEQIFYGGVDGRRPKRVLGKVIGEQARLRSRRLDILLSHIPLDVTILNT